MFESKEHSSTIKWNYIIFYSKPTEGHLLFLAFENCFWQNLEKGSNVKTSIEQ